MHFIRGNQTNIKAHPRSISNVDMVLNDIHIHEILKLEDRERTWITCIDASIKMRLIHKY